jgi:hypothetical protein
MNEPIKVFISYAHEDDWLRKELCKHLASAQNQELIKLWHDREIRAGANWAKEINTKLESADIILFLVSADFINSRYCSGIEMARVLERHRAGMTKVIPVIIRSCSWAKSPLGQFQSLPLDNKAIATWGDKFTRDTAWTIVSEEISKVARQIIDKRGSEVSKVITKTEKAGKKKEFLPNVKYFSQDVLFSIKHNINCSINQSLDSYTILNKTNLYFKHKQNDLHDTKVSILYANEDTGLKNELRLHLGVLQNCGLIELWQDRNINTDSEWTEKIDDNLKESKIILLLISVDFIISPYCDSIEMQHVLEMEKTKTAKVIPVIIRNCLWTKSPLGKLQGIPSDHAVAEDRGNKFARDTAWTIVVEEICRVAEQIRFKIKLPPLKIPIAMISTQTSNLKTVKIFLASSSELKDDREDIERLISRENKEYIKQGIFLQLELWEDFIDAISETRLQDEYNKCIRESDIFISLFHTKVGKYTEEEFQKALNAFKLKGKPLVYTYFKNEPINMANVTDTIVTLLDFQKKLKDLGHFYTHYENIEDLQYKFTQQLKKIIPTIMDDSSPIAQPLPEKSGYQQSGLVELEAQSILQEVENNLLDIVLESEKSIDYRNLRDLLKEKKWREADEETLKVMLKATNRESWLNSDSLKDFPSKDLKTIDSMWVSASDGQFGFSVQKKIWEECGGPTSYNKEWVKFCNLVGWYKGEIWLDYQELKFTLDNSYQGELPLAGRATGTGFERVFNFVQRAVAILSRQDL